MATNLLYIGVDLGGTQIRAILSDGAGRILGRAATLTVAHEGRDAVLARIHQVIDEVTGAARGQAIAGIGMGAPGPLDPRTGVIVHAPNLPGFRNVPLRSIVSERVSLPVALGNDANLAALGEQRYGTGRGVQDMIYMTVSTGIGGGIICGGELLLGSAGFAGEVGHQTILVDGPPCACGNRGCLEALAAGPAIARMGREAVAAGRGQTLLELAGGVPDRVTARLVSQAAAAGDAACREIIRRAGTYVGIGLANLANILNPELFVLGGGVTNSGEPFLDAVREAIPLHAMEPVRQVRVERAALGDDVVLMGAVALIAGSLSRTR